MDKNIFNKCLNVLETSKSDNELLAALLLVTKVAKAENSNEEMMRQIFRAVGLKFIIRLLKSNKTPEGCPNNAYQAVAAALLSCFCSVPNLMDDNPHLSDLLTPLVAIVSTPPSSGESEDKQLISDCYDCLACMITQTTSQAYLLQAGGLSRLCQTISNKYTGHERGLQLLLYLCKTNITSTWECDQEALEMIMNHLVQETTTEMGEDKFTLLSYLVTVLLSANKAQIEVLRQNPAVQQLRVVLFHLLQNRLSQVHREKVLQLCSVVMEQCGIPWMLRLGAQLGPKFLLLMAHLSCIEVRMTLESGDISQVTSQTSLLAHCYSLLEQVIYHMSGEPSLLLEAKQVSQLHSAMVGAFNAVIHFLHTVSEKPLQLDIMPVVVASIRVLSSWIAEETCALRTEIVSLLPFLLKTSQSTLRKCEQKTTSQPSPIDPDTSSVPLEPTDTSSTLSPTSTADQQSLMEICDTNSDPSSVIIEPFADVELFQFLMPGLCHLSAEETPRETLLAGDMPGILYGYLDYQWRRLVQGEGDHHLDKDSEIALTTACGVLLNIVVTEASRVMKEDVYGRLLQWTADKLKILLQKDGESNVVLQYNLMLVALMIVKNREDHHDLSEDGLQDMFRVCVRLLRQAHGLSSSDNQKHSRPDLVYFHCWEDTGELWSLALQVVCNSLQTFSWLSKIILSEKWLPAICRFLHEAQEETVMDSVRLAYEEVLSSMAQLNHTARKVILEARGQEIARKYKMTSLQTTLE